MYKKIISLITLIALMSFSCCPFMPRDKVHYIRDKKLKGEKVISVVKRSGEEIIFPKESSVWFEGDYIGGRVRKDTTIVLKYEDIDQINKGVIITKDGKSYLQTDYHRVRDDAKVEAYFLEKAIDYPVSSILISDVREVVVFSRRKGAIQGGIIGFLVGGAIGVFVIPSIPTESDFPGIVTIFRATGVTCCGIGLGSICGQKIGVQERYVINNIDNTASESD